MEIIHGSCKYKAISVLFVDKNVVVAFTADTMTVQDPTEMNICTALWTVVAYTVADMEDMLPRWSKSLDIL